MPRLSEVACRRRAVVVCAWEGNSTSHLGQHGMRRRGGRWLPAACGALAGRAAATWAEAQLGRMRMLSTRAVSWAVANHRVLGEEAGAAAGAVHPSSFKRTRRCARCAAGCSARWRGTAWRASRAGG